MSNFASPPCAVRRRALAWGHVNAAIWAVGNALTSGPLVSYLARDLGAQGLALGLVLALPNLGGLVRLVAPGVICRAGTARRACLVTSAASYLLVVGLPAIALAAGNFSRTAAVALMIGLLFAHQLLEYLGLVALWAWWGDLVPRAIRGRYFARRQRVTLAFSVPTLLLGGYLADALRDRYAADPPSLLLAYAMPMAVGALALLGSLWPLAMMPATRRYQRPQWRSLAATVRSPFVDRVFWRVLIFRGWFSLANGVSQTVQNVIFPKEILGLGVGPLSAMRVTTQLGQFAASGLVGRASDRYGNRPLLMAAQACVSASLVFYLLARPDSRWLVWGAWVLFAAYVAHNICLPNLVLKLAPPVDTPAYVAAAEALGSLLHAVATIGGGLLFDWLRAHSRLAASGPLASALAVLGLGLAMRIVAVPLAAAIVEPAAWTWREIVAGRRSDQRRTGPDPAPAAD